MTVNNFFIIEQSVLYSIHTNDEKNCTFRLLDSVKSKLLEKNMLFSIFSKDYQSNNVCQQNSYSHKEIQVKNDLFLSYQTHFFINKKSTLQNIIIRHKTNDGMQVNNIWFAFDNVFFFYNKTFFRCFYVF